MNKEFVCVDQMKDNTKFVYFKIEIKGGFRGEAGDDKGWKER